MDVLVCNGLGAYCGMKTVEYLGNKVRSRTLFHQIKRLLKSH